MGALRHDDLRPSETGTDPLRALIPALNRQLARVARVVTNNFRNPQAIQTQSNVSGPVVIATEEIEVVSIVLMNPMAGTTLSGITSGGGAVPNDATLPLMLGAGTFHTITMTPEKRLSLNQDLTLNYSLTNATATCVAINARRLG